MVGDKNQRVHGVPFPLFEALSIESHPVSRSTRKLLCHCCQLRFDRIALHGIADSLSVPSCCLASFKMS